MTLAPILPLIAVLNMSHVPDSTVQRWTTAVQDQVNEDLAPRWHVAGQVVFYGKGTHPPDGAWPVRIFDDRKGIAEGGYHLSQGDHERPYADIFVVKGMPISRSLSHEVIETLVDPYDDRFAADFPYAWFIEPVDPVQFSGYLKDGEVVADFVFPAWYDALTHDGVPVDQMGKLAGPGTFTHGGHAFRIDVRSGRHQEVW